MDEPIKSDLTVGNMTPAALQELVLDRVCYALEGMLPFHREKMYAEIKKIVYDLLCDFASTD